MKRLLILLLLTLFDIECMHYSLQSCPTCVGNAHETNAPFFSDECYQDLNLNTVDLLETDTSSFLD